MYKKRRLRASLIAEWMWSAFDGAVGNATTIVALLSLLFWSYLTMVWVSTSCEWIGDIEKRVMGVNWVFGERIFVIY